MSRRDELLALAERVEALTGPDREGDALVQRIAGQDNGEHWFTGPSGVFTTDEQAPAYTASIDTAMSLVPERYRRHITMVISPASIDMGRRDYQAYLGGHARKGRAQSFALALTAAALRALAEQVQP